MSTDVIDYGKYASRKVEKWRAKHQMPKSEFIARCLERSQECLADGNAQMARVYMDLIKLSRSRQQ